MRPDLVNPGAIGTVLFFFVLALLPLTAGDYLLALMVLILQYAYLGLAWNIMMGFAGQLSLGHALYFGLGGYMTGGLLVLGGVSPWIGLPVAAATAAVMGAIIGYFGFRFSVRGIYFALLTIAAAEFARILFDHWQFVGDSGGLFLPAVTEDTNPLAALRGGPMLFYYVLLFLTVSAFLLSASLMRGRIGYYWRAIREDEQAARALGVKAFRYKIAAVALSAGMTGIAGGLFALLNGSLFPHTVFGMALSIDILVAPVVGGVGTLFGPILGAFFVIPLGEMARDLTETFGIFGLNNLINGAVLIAVVLFMPQGLWPWLVNQLRRWRGRDA